MHSTKGDILKFYKYEKLNVRNFFAMRTFNV